MDWNFICRVIRNIDRQSEMAYQRGIKEMILETVLGWRDDQITEQLSLQLGSTERLVPDILIRKDERNSFIIEVKKPGHKKTNGDIEQLLSYMKQLEIPVGIYWGDEVEVYWKTIGDVSDLILLLSLNFNVREEEGNVFVSLFAEENYSLDKVIVFKNEREAKAIFESKVKDLRSEVLSAEFRSDVKNLIVDYLVKTGKDRNVVDAVMDRVSVSVSCDKEENAIEEVGIGNTPILDKKSQRRGRRGIGARPYAYNLMRQIIEKNRHLNFRQLYSIFKKKNYIEEVSTIIEDDRKGRWFLMEDEILTLSDGTKVAISNQWGFNNNCKPKMDFLREVAEKFGIDTSLMD